MGEKPKRKYYIVEGWYQLKYSLILIIAMMFAATVIIFSTLLTLHPAMNKELSGAVTESQAFTVGWNVIKGYLFRFSLLLVVALFVGIYLSHKIIGPIHRLEGAVKKMGEGDLSQHIFLRRGDEFAKLSQNLNILIEKFRQLLLENQEISGYILNQLKKMDSENKTGALSEEILSKHLTELTEKVTHMQHINSSLKLDSSDTFPMI